MELRLGGGEEAVTVHNMEEYVERTVDWALYRYIRRLGLGEIYCLFLYCNKLHHPVTDLATPGE